MGKYFEQGVEYVYKSNEVIGKQLLMRLSIINLEVYCLYMFVYWGQLDLGQHTNSSQSLFCKFL